MTASTWKGSPAFASTTGVDVILSETLTDGKMVRASRMLIIGTRPMTDLEYAGAVGRHIVRRGMADVLAYIGEEVGPEPVQSGQGLALWQYLKETAETHERWVQS